MLLFPLEQLHIQPVGDPEAPGGGADHIGENLISPGQQGKIALLFPQKLPDPGPVAVILPLPVHRKLGIGK